MKNKYNWFTVNIILFLLHGARACCGAGEPPADAGRIPGKELLFASGIIDVWYNWRLWEKKDRLLAVKLGAMIDRRIFATEIHPFRGTWESDEQNRVYGGVQYRF